MSTTTANSTVMIFTNDESYYESEYEDYIKSNEMDGEFDNYTFDEYVDVVIQDSWDAMIEEICCCDLNIPCVITGTLGLWNGTKTIIPVKYDHVVDAIRKCIDNIDHITIKIEDGALCIYAGHHDGTNKFKIYLLDTAYDDDYEDDSRWLKFPEDLF